MADDLGTGDPLARVQEKLRAIFRKSKEESARLSTIARIHLDLTGLRGRRERLLRDLGEASFLLLKERKYAIEELQSLVDEIAAFDRRIAGREEEIEGLRNRKDDQGASGGAAQGPSPDQR